MEVRLCIAGTNIHVRTESRAIMGAVESEFAGFVIEGDAKQNDRSPSFKLGIAEADRVDSWAGGLPGVPQDEAGVVALSGGGFLLHDQSFKCTIGESLAEASAHIAVNESAANSLRVMVRNLVTVRLLKRGGIVLHASCVEEKGRAFTFAGGSGTGKTTTARRCAPARVVADDFVFLEQEAPGAWAVLPAPAWGRDYTPNQRPVPLEAVFAISQGRELELERLSRPQAVASLANLPAVFGERFAGVLLDSLEKLTLAVPVYRLRLSLHDDVNALLSAVT